MSESIRLRRSPAAVGVEELDDSVWQARTARRAVRHRRGAATRLAAAKCVSLGVLLGSALLWGYAGSHQVAIRLALSVSALVIVGQALLCRRYALATIFAVITVIYNPFVAIFPMAGGWALPLVALAIVGFGASLITEPYRPAAAPRDPSTLQEGRLANAELVAWESDGGAPAPQGIEFVSEEMEGVRK
jgi:hypothetical protein